LKKETRWSKPQIDELAVPVTTNPNGIREINVAEQSIRGTLARNAVELIEARDLVYCPACKGDRMYRMERKGIFQKSIFSRFGYFPWQCKECGIEVMLRKRNRRRGRGKKTD
jgi:DNA-directed RNA polymerase subunit RPC12/RpoP